MGSISICKGKTLKLSNALERKISSGEWDNIQLIIEQMENYVKSKGATPIGPLIQKTEIVGIEEGDMSAEITLMRQANQFIVHTEKPYKMLPTIRVSNCLYAHYIGPDNKIKFANDKLNVYAFENEIDLADENYVVYVNQGEDEIVADVFIQMK